MTLPSSELYPDLLYDAQVRQRFVPEAHKPGLRTEFERDRARVVHSSALRRLGVKTQVLGPISDDFIRTRLTHSLEVAQVGRELGQALGCDPDIVDTACLAHDLGHPPFGHNGERILDQIAAGIGGFEGNAQTLRLLVRLEPKVVDDQGLPVGLNLTRASLDAVCKYPWQRGGNPQDAASPKFGAYQDDAEIFTWLRAGAPAGRRCLEAQVMDLSDDIGYSVHDVEDALRTGAFSPEVLDDDNALAQVIASTQGWYGTKVSADDLGQAYARLRREAYWITQAPRDYASIAALKNMTSQLIGRFCLAAHQATREVFGEGPLVRYQADLVIPPATRAEILLLKGIAVHFVMQPRGATHDHLAQQQTLFDLVEAVLERQGQGEEILEEPFASAYRQAGDHPQGREAGRLRAVIDQVASLTDISARAWHAQLCGIYSQPL